MSDPLGKSCVATGVILAGGKSRRMGRDKLPLKLGNVPLIDRVHHALASRCGEVIVVGAKGYAPAGAGQVPDLRPGEGPLAGIEAGLMAARYRLVFVAAGDLPFLTGAFVGCLLGLLSEGVWAVVPVLGHGPHPLCAVYRRDVQATVSAALDEGVRSVRAFLDGLSGVRYVGEEELRGFGDPNLLLMNVNSPEDLARARVAFREGVAGAR